MASYSELQNLNREHAARLEDITRQEEISRAYLAAWFSDLAGRTTGVSQSVDAAGNWVGQGVWSTSDGIWAATHTLGGIWGTLGDVWTVMDATRSDLATVTGGGPLDQFIADRTWQMAQELSQLHATIRDWAQRSGRQPD